MNVQKVKVIVNEIESTGNISINDNVIIIDLGITKQMINFRDISVYDKKENNTLSLILKNNRCIDLVFKDYLLLYKIIEDFVEESKSKKINNGVKCPDCGTVNHKDNDECENCGFVFKNKKVKIKRKNKKSYLIIVPIVLIIVIICGVIILCFKNNDEQTSNNNKEETNIVVTTSPEENKIEELIEKYSSGYDLYLDNVETVLTDRIDFDGIRDFKNNIEFLTFYDPCYYGYDDENDVLIEPTIIYCLIIKTKEKDTNIESFLYNFKINHYYEKELSVSILTNNGIVKPEFSDEYVNASKNGVVGSTGNYYYFISSKDQNFTNEMVALLESFE